MRDLPKGQLALPLLGRGGGSHFVPGTLLGTLGGGGENWGGRESISDWLAKEADLHKSNPQTTVGE